MPSNSIKDVNESSVAFLRSSTFFKRFITAVIMAPLGLGALYLGPPYSHSLVILLGIALIVEWILMIRHVQKHWTTKTYLAFEGIFYICGGLWGFYHYYLLHPLKCVMLLFVIWATDIGAYFFGQILGGPKLCPSISPNKTWSGSIGGLLLSLIVILIFMGVFPDLRSLTLMFVLLVLSVVGQLGDLLESFAKRHLQVKDSSSLLPGHGGFLDRFDSLLAVGFVLLMYYMFLFFYG